MLCPAKYGRICLLFRIFWQINRRLRLSSRKFFFIDDFLQRFSYIGAEDPVLQRESDESIVQLMRLDLRGDIQKYGELNLNGRRAKDSRLISG